MSKTLEKLGPRIFNAASSPTRTGILRLLSRKGPLAYTEIMHPLKLDPVRDAGKFVYHLKKLQRADLIAFDKQTKKYALTELGALVVEFARDMEEYVAVKKGRLFVRTSRLAIEQFDRAKISKSLMSEADIPYELAEEIASEAEERLIKLKTSYLTAPLIREFVNAILVERKLEEYRHKLTRLGMPVYDVTQLLRTASQQMLDAQTVQRAAGSSVMEEYALLNCLPRDIADAHMSGRIHIGNLEDWILKPCEFQHDLRFFLGNGLPQMGPPQNLSSALMVAYAVYSLTSTEISSEQSFDMFNIFLAPYAKGESTDRIQEALELFFIMLQAHEASKGGITLGYEFSIPRFLKSEEAIGPNGQRVGQYDQYQEEASKLLDASLSVMSKLSDQTPITNPRLLFKIRDGTFHSEESRRQMLSALRYSGRQFNPYYCVLTEDSKANYTSTGLRLSDDWTTFWQTDCQRTGCVDTLFVNLPRSAYEARKNDDRLFEELETQLDIVIAAHKAKRKHLQDIFRQSLLPVLSGADTSGAYMHSDSAAYVVSPIGLNEAVAAHTGCGLGKMNDDSTKLALNIVERMSKHMKEAAKESGIRFTVALRPCNQAATRLAELDIEEYGAATAVTQGLKRYPYYTDLVNIPLTENVPLRDRILLESRLQVAADGGHLLPINLSPSSNDVEGLFNMTQWITQQGLGYFTYTGIYSTCRNCNRWQVGLVPACPSCGSDKMEHAGRSSATIESLRIWPNAKARTLDKVVQYSPSQIV